MLLSVFLAAFSVFAPASAIAGLRLGKFLDGIDGPSKRFDLDSPPAERARLLFGELGDRSQRTAIIGSGTGYHVFWPDGSERIFDDDATLLDHIDDHGRRLGIDAGHGYVMSDIDYFKLRPLLLERPGADGSMIRSSSGEMARLHHLRDPSGISLGIEIRPNILVDADTPAKLEAFMDMLVISFDAADTHVLTLPSKRGRSVHQALDKAADGLSLEMAVASAGAVLDGLHRQKRRIVIVVGPIDDTDVLLRGADGQVAGRIAVDAMDEVARETHSSLVILDTGEARGSGAGSDPIARSDNRDLARRLKDAMTADDYGDFLSALGTENAPFLARTAGKDSQRLRLRMVHPGDELEMQRLASASVELTELVIGGEAPAVAAEQRARLVPFLPVWIQTVLIAGYAGAVVLLRSLIREWAALWPISKAGSRSSRLLRWGLRCIGFAVVAPIVGLIVIIAILISLPLLFIPFLPWKFPIRSFLFVKNLPFRFAHWLRRGSTSPAGMMQR